ncbi:hypothetical protein BC936DRAFT_138104 [Jimgerdemannia flammicorona]|uniref:Uncharacterized protein n=1 Tax=Jimgerdemannia flammicorona TaxID=994334 RepID=A0A433DIN2_9FUNG|nr:hypothetical protein BC936DRAFT_138104 [Jimgerdemannia flammicorona]
MDRRMGICFQSHQHVISSNNLITKPHTPIASLRGLTLPPFTNPCPNSSDPCFQHWPSLACAVGNRPSLPPLPPTYTTNTTNNAAFTMARDRLRNPIQK